MIFFVFGGTTKIRSCRVISWSIRETTRADDDFAPQEFAWAQTEDGRACHYIPTSLTSCLLVRMASCGAKNRWRKR